MIVGRPNMALDDVVLEFVRGRAPYLFEPRAAKDTEGDSGLSESVFGNDPITVLKRFIEGDEFSRAEPTQKDELAFARELGKGLSRLNEIGQVPIIDALEMFDCWAGPDRQQRYRMILEFAAGALQSNTLLGKTVALATAALELEGTLLLMEDRLGLLFRHSYTLARCIAAFDEDGSHDRCLGYYATGLYAAATFNPARALTYLEETIRLMEPFGHLPIDTERDVAHVRVWSAVVKCKCPQRRA